MRMAFVGWVALVIRLQASVIVLMATLGTTAVWKVRVMIRTGHAVGRVFVIQSLANADATFPTTLDYVLEPTNAMERMVIAKMVESASLSMGDVAALMILPLWELLVKSLKIAMCLAVPMEGYVH